MTEKDKRKEREGRECLVRVTELHLLSSLSMVISICPSTLMLLSRPGVPSSITVNISSFSTLWSSIVWKSMHTSSLVQAGRLVAVLRTT